MESNQISHQACANADQYWVNTLKKVYNFTQAQSVTLIFDGYDNAESVIHWKFDNVSKWDTNKTKLTPALGGCIYGDRMIKCLQGLVYWIRDMSIHVNTIVLTKFDR